MQIRKARKIGFFTALAMSLGSVIGIGIFLKNVSIINAQRALEPGAIEYGTFSFWSLLVSWIVATLITLCAALSFSEVASSRVSKAGIGGWAQQLGGIRLGRFTRVNHCLFYYGIYAAALPFLSVEGLYNAINIGVNGENSSSAIHFGYIFLGGVIVTASLIALNFFSLRSSAYFQNVALVLKIVPLVFVLVIGLVNANQSNILDSSRQDLVNKPLNDLYSGNPNFLIPSTKWFNVVGMFSALPAIFFTFDSYTNIGNLATEVKNPHRTIPLAMVLAIVIAAIIYILISLGSGLTGFGDAGSILSTLIPASTQNANSIRSSFNIVINVFITVSAFGVVNAMIASMLRSSESLVESGQIMGWRHLEKLNVRYPNLGGLTLVIIATTLFIIPIGITGIVTNSDAIADSITNFPSLFFIVIYGIIIAAGFRDRFTKKQCQRVFGFWVAAPVAILGIGMVFSYFFFYQYIIHLSQDPLALSSAGLFFNSSNPGRITTEWYNYDDAIMFWSLLMVFIFFPWLNHFVIKKTGGYKLSDALLLNGKM